MFSMNEVFVFRFRSSVEQGGVRWRLRELDWHRHRVRNENRGATTASNSSAEDEHERRESRNRGVETGITQWREALLANQPDDHV